MKNLRTITLIICVMITLQGLDVETQASNEFVRRSAHPYLTYSDANIAKLKERIQNEPSITDAWEKMLAQANRMIESSANERGRRGRNRSNELLCLVYRMTGDKKFGEHVKQSLFKQRLGGRNDSMLLKRNPPWNSGLDSGEACESFGIAYDSIYDLLTPEERKILASRLAEQGILPIIYEIIGSI